MKNVKYLIISVLALFATQSYAQGYKITLTNGKTVTVRADETEAITFTTDNDIKTDLEGFVSVSSVSLNHTSLELVIGNTQKLVATVSPADATNAGIQWQSSNNSVASVNSEGLVSALSAGTATITAKSVDGSDKSATCTVTVSERTNNAPSAAMAVDLGLSVKWANMNVGATEVAGTKTNSHTGQLDCYGEYYAWGETSPKDSYSWSNLKYCTSYDATNKKYTFSKYVGSSTYGTIDYKNFLVLTDDAARANWGGTWRMPTDTQQEELIKNCYWEWTTSYNGSGVPGYIVYKVKHDSDKGKKKYSGSSTTTYLSYSLSDTHIFLPASGGRRDGSFNNVGSCGHYWSCQLVWTLSTHASMLDFSSGDVYSDSWTRNRGHTVRAVCP